MTRSGVRAPVSKVRQSRSLAATLALLVLAIAPLALAQKPTKPKKGAKPEASASASAPADEAAPPTPTPAPTQATSSAPTTPEPSASAGAETTEAAAETAPSVNDSSNTTEDPAVRYYFVGLRYRGTIIPAFLEHLFVNEGGTVYSNTIGAELDMRRDGQSMIPWIQYTDYGFGDTLFWQKGTDDTANNYSMVNSGLKAIYLGVDLLWSTPVANHLDFEYGFGVGIGAVFGTLINNWVYLDNPNGKLVGSNGQHYTACQGQTDDRNPTGTPFAGPPACETSSHQNATIAKVGNYVEQNWFGGGSIPVVFPHIAFPQLSLRYKPIKQLETRLSLGFSVTGFWFGLSADYGLEKPPEKAPEKPNKSGGPILRHDML
jgi:hypothetical protein